MDNPNPATPDSTSWLRDVPCDGQLELWNQPDDTSTVLDVAAQVQ
jgi:hypothetical protein